MVWVITVKTSALELAEKSLRMLFLLRGLEKLLLIIKCSDDMVDNVRGMSAHGHS